MKRLVPLGIALGFFFAAAAGSQNRRVADKESIEGVVIDATTRLPIADVQVVFTATKAGAAPLTVFTNRDGSFVAAPLSADIYRIGLSREGFYDARPSVRRISLGARERITDVNLELVPLSDIRGRIVDRDGVPESGAAVAALPLEYVDGKPSLSPVRVGREVRAGGSSSIESRTDERGEYRLSGLQAGKYYVVTWSDSDPSVYYPSASDPSEALFVEIRQGQDLFNIDFRLDPRELYKVRFPVVVPPAPSAPVQRESKNCQILSLGRAGVSATVAGTRVVERTGDMWEIKPGLPRGSYEVFCSAYPLLFGNLIGHVSLNIVDRDVEAAAMVVHPNLAVRGRVSFDSNSRDVIRLDQLRVHMRLLDSWPEVMTPSLLAGSEVNSAGEFTFQRLNTENVPPGNYQVTVSGLPLDSYLASVKYEGREFTPSRVSMDRPGLLELRLVSIGGALEGVVKDGESLAADVVVVLSPSADRWSQISLFRTVRTDDSGRFAIKGIPPGEYSLVSRPQILPPGSDKSAEFMREFERWKERVTVRDGLMGRVNLRIAPN